MNALSAPLAALIQMTSGIDPEANLATVDRAMGEAAARGVAMAFLPEMSLLLDRDRARSGGHITREADSPWPSALQAMAQRHGIWLHSGSMPRSEEHTSELQSLMRQPYAVFCLKKTNKHTKH